MTNGTHANESFRFSQHHCYSSPPPPNKIPQVDGDGEEESISELDLKMAYKMSCFLNDDRWGDGTKNDGRFTFYQACGKHMKIGVLFGLVDSTHHNYSRRCKECNMSRLNDTWLLHVSLIPSKTTNASTALAFHPRRLRCRMGLKLWRKGSRVWLQMWSENNLNNLMMCVKGRITRKKAKNFL